MKIQCKLFWSSCAPNPNKQPNNSIWGKFPYLSTTRMRSCWVLVRKYSAAGETVSEHMGKADQAIQNGVRDLLEGGTGNSCPHSRAPNSLGCTPIQTF